MAAGVVALIFSFLDFYTADIGGASSSAWGTGLFPVATLMVIFVLIMAIQIALTRFANVQMPDRVGSFTWDQIHLVLGSVAALLAISWLIRDKGPVVSFGVGFWFVLLACLAALVGAVLLVRERAATP